jgi:non-specific serine/threonine protein kinase
LRVQGEQVYPVPPLPLPPIGPSVGVLGPESLCGFAAVRLFVERARAVVPAFVLTEANAAAVVDICRRLDGLPLAIELAAARVGALAPQQIAARLDDRFRPETESAGGRPPRHQTLRALLDWSYDLLAPAEQALLRRLSVFAGGWDLEAAEAVCGTDGFEAADVLDLLLALVDKSLVVAEVQPAVDRYRLLESVREYADEKLETAGEATVVQDRHATYLLQLARTARRALVGPAQAEWVQRLEMEHHNLRAALARMLAAGDADTALRLCGLLSMFWYIRGHYREGRDWIARALARGASATPRARAAALHGAASLAGIQHDHGEALELIAESVALWRVAGDQRGLAAGLAELAMHARHVGDLAGARRASEEALAIYAVSPDPWGQRLALGVLGWVAEAEGDPVGAERFLQQSLAAARAAKSPIDVALQLNNLGILALRRGDTREAQARHGEALLLSRDVDAREPMAGSLEGLAGVAAARAQHHRAARLLGAAAALREAIGSPRVAQFEEEYRRVAPAVQAELGGRAFREAAAEGRALPLAEAVAFALAEATEPAAVSVRDGR